MADKKQLTKLFLEQAGFSATDEAVKEWMKNIWVTPYSPIGLRLSAKGHAFLKTIVQLDSYTYQVKPGTVRSLKMFLQMNKFLTAPFYITEQHITLYGETDATMMGLMSGDIQQYLENFTRE